MATFSPTDAGLEGFRLTRENPRAFLRWVIFSFVVSLLEILITVNLPASMRDSLELLASKETPDLSNFLGALGTISPVLIFSLAVQAMMAAAVYRIIFRHDDDRFGYLRLGADELRLIALTVIYVVVGVLAIAILSLAFGLIGVGIMALSPNVGIWFEQVSYFGLIIFFIFVLVRLSLAPVATFAERRLALLESWELTRGQFWRLLGAYALAFACIVVIWITTLFLFLAIAGVVVLLSGGQLSDLSGAIRPDEHSIRSYMAPTALAYLAVSSIVGALYFAVIAAPGAVAYRSLHGDPPSMSGHDKKA